MSKRPTWTATITFTNGDVTTVDGGVRTLIEYLQPLRDVIRDVKLEPIVIESLHPDS